MGMFSKLLEMSKEDQKKKAEYSKLLTDEIDWMIHFYAIVDKYTHKILNTKELAKLIVEHLKEDKIIK